MATTAVIHPTAPTLPAPLVSELQRLMKSIPTLLPADMPFEKFRTAAWLHLTTVRGIEECAPPSVAAGILKAAQHGMLLGQDAYLLPFTNRRTKRKEATFVADYRGIIRSLERTGKVRKAFAHPVYANDHFVCDYLADRYEHQPKLDGKRGDLKCFYGCILLKDGTPHVDVLTLDEVDRVKQRAPAHDEGPWVTDYIEMGRKTAVKRTAKYCQLTPEVTALLDDEDAREASDYNPRRGQEAAAALFGGVPEDYPTQGGTPPPAEVVDPVTGEVVDFPEPEQENLHL